MVYQPGSVLPVSETGSRSEELDILDPLAPVLQHGCSKHRYSPGQTKAKMTALLPKHIDYQMQ